MDITETPTLIIYETDSLEPPLKAMFRPTSRYEKGPDGAPIIVRDARMITTRGYLNLLAQGGDQL